jgi:cysteinyl-tRNA synthetase
MGHDTSTVRYLLLSTHYRQQFNFTFEGLNGAKSAIDRLRNFVRRLLYADGRSSYGEAGKLMDRVQKDFCKAMDDDLNIGLAMASLFEFVREANNLIDANSLSKEEARDMYDLMAGIDRVLGVIGEVKAEEELPKDAKELILKREEARKAKDWKTADQLRVQLKKMGVVIEDTDQGAKWRIERS